MTTFDFHVHSKVRSKSAFDIYRFCQMLGYARERGVDSLAISEHAHARFYTDAYEFLRAQYNYNGEYYDADGVRVFTGVEVSVSEGFDIVCVGERERIARIQRKAPLVRGQLSLEDLFCMLDDHMMVILAHPFRKHQFVTLPPTVLDRLDAIEINGNELVRGAFKAGSREQMLEALKMAAQAHRARVEELGHILTKSAIGGSDSHVPERIGSIVTVLQQDVQSLADIKNQVKINAFSVKTTDALYSNLRA